MFSHAFEAAIDDYDKALELSPNEAKAYNGRGWALGEVRSINEAIRDFKRAIELEPNCASPHFNLGLLLFYKNADFDEALTCFNRADKLKPRDCSILCARGDLFIATVDYAAASRDYTCACESDPANAGAHLRFSLLLSRCPEAPFRDGRRALSHAITCCELTDWNDSASLQALASAHAECGQFDDAIRWQAKAIPLTPEIVQDLAEEKLTVYRDGEAWHFL